MPKPPIVPKNVIHALDERNLLGYLDEVCRAHHVTRIEVCSIDRSRSIVTARHELWWRLRQLKLSYVEIARLFGRNHTSVLHGVTRRDEQILAQPRAA